MLPLAVSLVGGLEMIVVVLLQGKISPELQ